jgi:glycine C-acetyltransferase
VILPEGLDPKLFGRKLMTDFGIWASPIWFIAKPRMRITANALHTKAEMDQLVEAMVNVRADLFNVAVKEPLEVSA